MSIFGSFFEKRTAWTGGGNLTDYSDFWYGIGGSISSSGTSVSAADSMRYWAYYACISLIAQTVGCFPLNLKRKVGKHSRDATDEPLYDVMKLKPNDNWTSMYWREFGQTQQFNQGNDYSWIERTRLGIKKIWPLDPWQVTPKQAKNGEVVEGRTMKPFERYYIVPKQDGGQMILFQEDILHVPGFGYDGLSGQPFWKLYGLDVIGRGLSQNEFASKWFKNGVFTSGAFEHPGSLGDNREKFHAAVRARYGGQENTGVPLVLEGDMKWKPEKLSLIDQQFIEQEKEIALQVCGMLHVPPHKISIPTTHQAQNNTEEMNKHFLDTTMLPHVRKREEIYDTQLLTKRQRAQGLFFKFNYDHFLRPDAKKRAEIAAIRQGMGVPLNRYLSREDEEPTEFGDTEWVSQNLATAEAKIKEADKPAETIPEPEEDAEPESE